NRNRHAPRVDRRKGAQLMAQQTGERQLTELHNLRRNRFYYGKLMDVLHSSMESDYGRSAQMLFDRLVLSPGVICGLQVSEVVDAGKHGIRVSPGAAVDGWGRL